MCNHEKLKVRGSIPNSKGEWYEWYGSSQRAAVVCADCNETFAVTTHIHDTHIAETIQFVRTTPMISIEAAIRHITELLTTDEVSECYDTIIDSLMPMLFDSGVVGLLSPVYRLTFEYTNSNYIKSADNSLATSNTKDKYLRKYGLRLFGMCLPANSYTGELPSTPVGYIHNLYPLPEVPEISVGMQLVKYRGDYFEHVRPTKYGLPDAHNYTVESIENGVVTLRHDYIFYKKAYSWRKTITLNDLVKGLRRLEYKIVL